MTYIGIDSESLTGIMSDGFYYLSIAWRKRLKKIVLNDDFAFTNKHKSAKIWIS